VRRLCRRNVYGTRSVALAPRHPIADYSFDLVVRRLARLIFAGLKFQKTTWSSVRKPGASRVFGFSPLRFRKEQRYITLAPWTRPTTTI
jgi:hypothetical protein